MDKLKNTVMPHFYQAIFDHYTRGNCRSVCSSIHCHLKKIIQHLSNLYHVNILTVISTLSKF